MEDREAVLVSACLLGVCCTHRGGHKTSEAVIGLGHAHRVIPVCPEVAGGLATPRPEAVRGPDGRVRTADGRDVTTFYERGAAHAVAVARAAGVKRAVLKARSPSCGEEGVTTEALRREGIAVMSEEDLAGGDNPAQVGTSGPRGRAGA